MPLWMPSVEELVWAMLALGLGMLTGSGLLIAYDYMVDKTHGN